MNLQVVPTANQTITLYRDNNGAVASLKELRRHNRFKQIERKYHLIRDIVDGGKATVC